MCFIFTTANKLLKGSWEKKIRALNFLLWLNIFFWITHGLHHCHFRVLVSMSRSQSYRGDFSLPNAGQWDQGQGDLWPLLRVGCRHINSTVVLGLRVSCTVCNLMLKNALFTQKRLLMQFIHKAYNSQPSFFSSPLFLVARHSVAYEYNIYFYLFYSPLYLKSLGSTQDAGAGDFLDDKMLCVVVCPRLVTGFSHMRLSPQIWAWVSAWSSKCRIPAGDMGPKLFKSTGQFTSIVHTNYLLCKVTVLK